MSANRCPGCLMACRGEHCPRFPRCQAHVDPQAPPMPAPREPETAEDWQSMSNELSRLSTALMAHGMRARQLATKCMHRARLERQKKEQGK